MIIESKVRFLLKINKTLMAVAKVEIIPIAFVIDSKRATNMASLISAAAARINSTLRDFGNSIFLLLFSKIKGMRIIFW